MVFCSRAVERRRFALHRRKRGGMWQLLRKGREDCNPGVTDIKRITRICKLEKRRGEEELKVAYRNVVEELMSGVDIVEE
ncbi:hypothetical protein AAC387_Pa07g1817 [Persea americana]